MRMFFKNFWFWDISKLIKALKNDEPVNEVLYYFFFILIFSTLSAFSPSEDNFLISVLVVLDFITIVSIGYLYEKKSGKNFIKNFVCLSLPIFLRYFLFCVIVGVVASFFMKEQETRDLFGRWLTIVGNILANLYIGFYMNKVIDKLHLDVSL